MTDLTKQLAEALRQLAAAHEIGVLLSRVGLLPAKEALAAYDAAQQVGEQALPPLPEREAAEWRIAVDMSRETPTTGVQPIRSSVVLAVDAALRAAQAAQPLPVRDEREALRIDPALKAILEQPWTLELAYQEGFGDARNFKRYEAAWELSVTKTKGAALTQPAPEAQQAEPESAARDASLPVTLGGMWMHQELAREMEGFATPASVLQKLRAAKPQQPAQAVPLTDEQIEAAWNSVDMRHARGDATRKAFARAIERAIERAHGIGVKLAGGGEG